MKTGLYITLIMLALGFTTKAQEMDKGIAIDGLRTDITDKRLTIDFKVKAAGLEVKCDGRLTLEFAVESADRRLVLPVVVYSGKQRYIYEHRREELSGDYITEPYKIYKGIKANKIYELDYNLSIPYYMWMEHAELTYREYLHGCQGDYQVGGGVLIADLNPEPVYVEPEIWAPNPKLYTNLVSFLIPEVEEVKARASMLSLNVGFPVNVTQVRREFGNNTTELQRADSLVTAIQSNNLLNINAANIRGYASPEGTYAVNERLARGRSESFKQYLANNYPNNEYVRTANTMWTPEDWNGLGLLVADWDIPNKADILAIVNDNSIAPDTKDRMLNNITWWSSNYKTILKEVYPKLRRIELRIDYTVNKISDNQARELIYTNPDLLSLEEIYRVARFYEPGSKQYREVYEIAAQQYPKDVIACNNAAAALLQEGDADAALSYLEKIDGKPESLINYGVYHYISGELDKAVEYFTQAKEAGIEQADHNLNLIKPRSK